MNSTSTKAAYYDDDAANLLCLHGIDRRASHFYSIFSQLIIFDRMVTLKPAVGIDASGLMIRHPIETLRSATATLLQCN